MTSSDPSRWLDFIGAAIHSLRAESGVALCAIQRLRGVANVSQLYVYEAIPCQTAHGRVWFGRRGAPHLTMRKLDSIVHAMNTLGGTSLRFEDVLERARVLAVEHDGAVAAGVADSGLDAAAWLAKVKKATARKVRAKARRGTCRRPTSAS